MNENYEMLRSNMPKVSRATERLAQPKMRKTPNPFDYSEFRGLVHADYTDAVNSVTHEQDHLMRSTKRLLESKPDSKLVSLLQSKQKIQKGPEFE